MEKEMIEGLREITTPGQVMTEEPMDTHTTFRAGGRASVFVEITGTEQLGKVMRYLKKTGMNYFVLGNGSNLLVSDQGYDGCILHIGSGMDQIRVSGTRMTVQAGASLAQAAAAAAENGLTGLEFASGIPGTVGGAVRMNAGAYNGEISHVVSDVKGIDQNGETNSYNNAEMEFGYRKSLLMTHPFVVTEVVFQLAYGDQQVILDTMKELNRRRREKQPLEYPSAGSTFKRPEGNYAGKLVMEAGMSGFCIGGAQVSEKHCGFVINRDHASADDIWHVIREVKARVYQKAGVELEPEVILLGRFQ